MRVVSALTALSIAFVLAACSPPEEVPPVDSPSDPGLYDLSDGTVQAVGTLEWFAIEGGFWAIVDESPEGDGRTIAVIANGDEIQDDLAPLRGRTVLVTGEPFEGVSIRMAGPEIIADTVEELSDAADASE